MFCKNCGKELEENAVVCSQCGALVEEAQVPQQTLDVEKPVEHKPATIFCQNCGQEINANAAVCVHCGAWVNGKPVTPVEQKPATVFCRNCGKEINEKAAICVHCGAWTDANQQPSGKTEAKNGMAIAGFVCSFFVPILGWVFGGIGLSKAGKIGGKGKGFAIAAIAIATANFILGLMLPTPVV